MSKRPIKKDKAKTRAKKWKGGKNLKKALVKRGKIFKHFYLDHDAAVDLFKGPSGGIDGEHLILHLAIDEADTIKPMLGFGCKPTMDRRDLEHCFEMDPCSLFTTSYANNSLFFNDTEIDISEFENADFSGLLSFKLFEDPIPESMAIDLIANWNTLPHKEAEFKRVFTVKTTENKCKKGGRRNKPGKCLVESYDFTEDSKNIKALIKDYQDTRLVVSFGLYRKSRATHPRRIDFEKYEVEFRPVITVVSRSPLPLFHDFFESLSFGNGLNEKTASYLAAHDSQVRRNTFTTVYTSHFDLAKPCPPECRR